LCFSVNGMELSEQLARDRAICDGRGEVSAVFL
jgi:hypothetical protein